MSEKNSFVKISDLQRQARHSFTQAGIETAALDARVLLCHVCQMPEAEIIAYPDRPVDKKQVTRFYDLVTKRARRIPLAYLLGSREFWGLDFSVNSQTLIPRPETEFAVELAVECAKNFCQQNESPRILDLGTGTGCLLISILHEVEGASGIGVDINSQAVDLATKNAKKLGVEKRADFRCMNWGQGLQETFDIIVSNPPYIRSGDLEGLMPEVAQYEPVRALDGGVDGLGEYRKIIPQACQLLKTLGILILEIGEDQANDVLDLLKENGFQPLDPNRPVQSDLAGCERIIGVVYGKNNKH